MLSNIDIGHIKGEVKNVINHTLTCEGLGMIPNSEADGIRNYAKLTAAIVAGNNILVDNAYYLSNSSVANVTDITGITLTGITNNAELLFNDIHYLWKPKNNTTIERFHIEKLKLTNTAVTYGLNNAVRFFYSPVTETFYIKEYTVKDCLFTKGFAMFQGTAKQDNPAVVTFGFGRISIVNNTFKDAAWQQSFFKFADYPHEMLEFRNNKVYDFDNVFLNCALDNLNTYTSAVAARMKKLIWKDNQFYNADGIWSDSLTGNQYFTPILYEGYEAEVVNNHVEGMKCDNNVKVVYDGYLSCEHLESHNNVYKNNMHVNPGAELVTLMKCKGSSILPTGASTRHIYDNRYTIDETWATTVATARGTNIAKVSHNILDIQQAMDTLNIHDNLFYVCK